MRWRTAPATAHGSGTARATSIRTTARAASTSTTCPTRSRARPSTTATEPATGLQLGCNPVAEVPSSAGRVDHAELAVVLFVRAGGVVEARRRACGRAVAEGERPKAGDDDDRPVALPQLPLVDPLPVQLRVRADAAVAEGADEQVAGED